MEAERLQVVVQQKQHETRCVREDLSTARQERNQWRDRAETTREECERLRKQVEDLMPPERFLHVFPVRGFRRGEVEEMMRVQTLHLPRAHLVVEVGLEHFQLLEMRNPEVYRAVLADHIARQARKVVLEGLEIR